MARRYTLFFTMFLSIIIAQTKTPLQWKTELAEDPKKIVPLQNGAYVFLSADEYAWLYETATGKKIWSVKIEDYVENGMHNLVDDSLYLVSDEDTLKCYAIFQNTLLWKKRYVQIEQDQFSSAKEFDSLLVLTYETTDLCINLSTGVEVWRKQIPYENDLIEQGTHNAIQFNRRNKYLAFLEDGSSILVDAVTGEKLFTLQQSEPNADLIGQKRAWYFHPEHEKYIAIVTKKEFVCIDLKEDTLIARHPVSIDENYNVLVSTNTGCGVFGEEKFVHINTSNGAVSETTIDIDEVRNYVVTATDSGDVMILSLENKLMGMNLDNGKLIWQTVPKYPLVNGFMHRLVANGTNTIVVTYLDPSDDLKLYLMSIDALTGKIDYRTLVAHADESLPKRELPLSAILPVDQTTLLSFGFDKVGFDYTVSVENGRIKVFVYTTSDMIEPNTETDGGEGIAIIDQESGTVISKNYMKIAQGLSFNEGFNSLAKPLQIGSMHIVAGNKNLVALNAETGSLRWMLIEQDLSGSYAIDAEMIDTILYVRTGGSKIEYSYDQKKEKLKMEKLWEEEEYTLLAVDTSSGKVLWKKEFDADPTTLFPSYTLFGYHVGDTTLLYGSEKFLYCASLKKNSLLWSFEFSDSGIGSYSYDDLFKQSSYWDGEGMLAKDSLHYFSDQNFPYITKGIVGEKYHTGITRALQVNYSPSLNSLIALGDDGVAAIDAGTGKRLWFYEWDYSAKSIQYRPMFIKNNLFYCINEKATLLNLKTGKVVWETEIDKEAGIFIVPNCSSVLFIHKDELRGSIIP